MHQAAAINKPDRRAGRLRRQALLHERGDDLICDADGRRPGAENHDALGTERRAGAFGGRQQPGQRLSALALGGVLRYVPLAALGGVLLITAWRMNEWESIHFFVNARLKHAMFGFAITMLATAALDLTQAILIGIAISALIYLRQSATSTTVTMAPVNPELLKAQGMPITATCPSMHVYYLTGPVFFGSVTTVLEAFETAGDYHSIIISMRGVPLIDAMGIQALQQIVEEHHARGGEVLFTALQPAVLEMFRRTGLFDRVGARNIFWSSAHAIIELHEQRMAGGCPRCGAHGEGCAVLRMAQERLAREANTALGMPNAGTQ